MTDQPKPDRPKSRYEQVKAILDEAQGDANPSYQGHKRFWNLPLEEFLQVTIYGIRMIALAGEEDFCQDYMEAAGHSCCESTPAADNASASPPEQPADASTEKSVGESCCGPSGLAATFGTVHSRGRGAASGLIKGLKGQFPFDGSQFPRLPWGGKQVSNSDILFIESWIDDGCPATDEVDKARIEVSQTLKMALAQG